MAKVISILNVMLYIINKMELGMSYSYHTSAKHFKVDWLTLFYIAKICLVIIAWKFEDSLHSKPDSEYS